MAFIGRKNRFWGVRTIYRNGTTRLVGPYRNRRAAVEALLNGDGRVLESVPVYLGDFPGLQPPIRVLREKRLDLSGEVEVIVPSVPPELIDAILSLAQAYQIEVTGTDLDSPLTDAYRIVFTDGSVTFLVTDPAITLVSPTEVHIYSSLFAGRTLTSIEALDSEAAILDALDFPDITFPGPDYIASEDIDELVITGTNLLTDLDRLEVVTDQGTFYYYDPLGPNAGLNPVTATISLWTTDEIRFVDTDFSTLAPVVVDVVNFLRDDSSVAAFIDANLAILTAGSAVSVTSVGFEAHTSLNPFRVVLTGTGFDTIVEVRFSTSAGPLAFNTTDDPAVFVEHLAGTMTLESALLEGVTLQSLQVAATISGPAEGTFDINPDFVVPSGLLSSPQPGWVMFEGTNLGDLDRLDVLVPGNGGLGPEEWITYYGPLHPDYATNPVQVDILAWDTQQIVVSDARYTFDNDGMSPITEFQLFWTSGDVPWGEDGLSLTVVPGYSGPVTSIQSVPTDRYGLAILGTGLDLIDTLSVQGCGNGEYGDSSAQQGPNNFQTTYEETDPEVVSWTASQIIINDPDAFLGFSGFVWQVQAGSTASPFPYWYVNYPADNEPMVNIVGPDAYSANFWFDIGTGIQNGNVFGYEIAETQEDGLDRVEIDTVEEGTLVVHGPNSLNVASSTPGVTATYLGSGISLFDAAVFDNPLTITEYRAYRGNGALYYTSAPDGVFNPTALGGEVNEVLSVSGDDVSGVTNIQAQYPDDPALAGFRFNLDIGEFEQEHTSSTVPVSPYDQWQNYPALAGRVVQGVTPINAEGSGIAGEYIGADLPISLPSVLPLSMSTLSFYTNSPEDGLAQFSVLGNYLQLAARLEMTASGDETSFDIPADALTEQFFSAGPFTATGLPGCLLEDATLYDELDNVVATGALNFQWAEVTTVDGAGVNDGQTFGVEGKQLHGIAAIEADWSGAEYRVYYHPSGPEAGSNDPDLIITEWTDLAINLTDPYIGSFYPGVTELSSFLVNAPSSLGQFYNTSDPINIV